jgi:hypothetical protein
MNGEVSGWIPQELGLGRRKKMMNSRTRTTLDLRMAMERVWTDIGKPDPCPNPSASLCPTHEIIHGHGCRPKSKSDGYLDIHGYPCP